MKDWSDEVFTALEKTIKDFEQLSYNISEWVETVTEELTEEVIETVDFIAEQIDIYLPREIEDFFRDVFQPLIDIDEGWETEQDRENQNYWSNPFTDDFYWNPKIEPSSEFHPACIGCTNYHGRVYNGNILICGMHPYGWETENCPDWEDQGEKD
jgi:hypothetical protein